MCMRESSPHQSTHQRHSDFMAKWSICESSLESGVTLCIQFDRFWFRPIDSYLFPLVPHFISKMNWSADVLLWAMLQVSGARGSTKNSKHPAHYTTCCAVCCAWSEKTVTLRRSPAYRVDGQEVWEFIIRSWRALELWTRTPVDWKVG